MKSKFNKNGKKKRFDKTLWRIKKQRRIKSKREIRGETKKKRNLQNTITKKKKEEKN